MSAAASNSTRYAVTGASGYLGRCLIDALIARGRPVIALGRRQPAAGVAQLAFDLRYGVADVEALRRQQADVLVHCAYDFTAGTRQEARDVNVSGTARLLEAAERAGINRIVAISTMSAFEGCQSIYGQTKLAIERLVAEKNGISLRPGLIWGPRPGGMMATLQSVVRALPVVPLIGRGTSLQYLVRDADLVDLIVRLAEAPVLPALPYLTACHERPLEFRQILRVLAASQGRRRVFLPVPARAIELGLRVLERALPGRNLRADSVVGLIHANPAPVFRADVLAELGMPPFQAFDR